MSHKKSKRARKHQKAQQLQQSSESSPVHLPSEVSRTLLDVTQNHPIAGLQHALRAQQIAEVFDEYTDQLGLSMWTDALYKFATVRPLVYFNKQIILDCKAYLNENPQTTIDGLIKLKRELSHAIKSLLRPNVSWEKEEHLELGIPRDILDFESIWHPEYQRYCEHIFNHFIKIPLYILGQEKNKDYTKPSLPERVKLLNDNNLNFTEGYNQVVRNALAHGTIDFGLNEIHYIEKENTKVMRSREFAVLFDNLVNTCHSLLIAIILFIAENEDLIDENGIENLPLGLRGMVIEAMASYKDFEILNFTENDLGDGIKQLLVATKITTRSRNAMMFEGVHLGWFIHLYSGTAYDRVGISFDCGTGIDSILFLKMERLRTAMRNKELVENCLLEIIQPSLLWTDEQDTNDFSVRNCLYLTTAIYNDILFDTDLNFGVENQRSEYTLRHLKNASNHLSHRLFVSIVLRKWLPIRREFIQQIIAHAIEILKTYKVKKYGLEGEYGDEQVPEYIYVHLYRSDARIRTLSVKSSWKHGNLLARAEWILNWRGHSYDTLQEYYVFDNGLAIEYNPQIDEWIEQKP
ncbi:hypothetical protein [Herpetosiphon giganteus]|uniref:hypothetical protein n=1 Tax=Herpetosiphon giganteus TaxID=2029754 RepID=UPI0019594ACF|nr:hypothetical protein [Herpetosiphon giganteus]MBM7843783.1 hypothetical protein [Herpetosiphon giganteus]